MQQLTIRMDDRYELFNQSAHSVHSFPPTTAQYIALLANKHNILDNEKKSKIFGHLRLGPVDL